MVALLAVALGGCALGPAPDALPTLAPSATPASSATPVPLAAMRELFDDPTHLALHTGATEGALFACADGTYRITVRKPQLLVRSLVGGPLADGALDVDVSFPRGTPATAAGLIFRQQDEQNFYMASISSDGFYSLDVREGGAWRALIEWTNWPTIDTRGGPNRLRVVAQGDLISLYLNGELLGQASDATFASGDVALGVNTFATADVTAVFDNLAVEPQHTRKKQ